MKRKRWDGCYGCYEVDRRLRTLYEALPDNVYRGMRQYICDYVRPSVRRDCHLAVWIENG